jgi:hypothetical protein
VAGLLYARNLHSHELTPLGLLADALRSRPAEQPPPPPPSLGPNDRYIAVAPVRVLLAWPRLADLPPPVKREKKNRDQSYKHRVATRPLAAPFGDAMTFFVGKRSLRRV